MDDTRTDHLLVELADAYQAKDADRIERIVTEITRCPALTGYCLLSLMDMVS